ncbi:MULTISPECIES: family 43 glycosylhydrolase [Curtobacterium]|uniref:family 43 glycosylhydrolase n=1 Tax=Curtobacterium flaccumfaciens TaxID=2035 RepID=UPI003EE80FBE
MIVVVASVVAVVLTSTLPRGPGRHAHADVATTQTNGTQFLDTDGHPIQAHGGDVIEVDRTYYWVGENRTADDRFAAVSLYRSTDLSSWTYVRDVLTTASSADLRDAKIERPKLLRDRATGHFVLWMHAENGQDYSEARTAVATSDRIDGDYRWRGSSRPLGHESRDFTVFQDTDGTGYLVSATAGNANLALFRLDDDLTAARTLVATLWPGAFREAPAMFERDGTYYLITSGATGWDPNQAMYATAPAPGGPWSALEPLGDATAFDSQVAFVLPVAGSAGTSYLYVGDRWAGAHGGPVNESPSVWLPLRFDDAGKPTLRWSDRVAIDVRTGRAVGTGSTTPFRSFRSTTAGDCLDAPVNGPTTTPILWECNGGRNQQWQVVPTTGDRIVLRSRSQGTCLTHARTGEGDGGTLLARCDGSTRQDWDLRREADGTVSLRSSAGCLGASSTGSPVATTTCSRHDAFSVEA